MNNADGSYCCCPPAVGAGRADAERGDGPPAAAACRRQQQGAWGCCCRLPALLTYDGGQGSLQGARNRWCRQELPRPRALQLRLARLAADQPEATRS